MIADSQIARLSLRIRIPPGRDAPVGGSRSYHSELDWLPINQKLEAET